MPENSYLQIERKKRFIRDMKVRIVYQWLGVLSVFCLAMNPQ
jgi:hypothetical protein